MAAAAAPPRPQMCLTPECPYGIEPRPRVLGLHVWNQDRLGFCADCYQTKTTQALSDTLIHGEYYVCVNMAYKDQNKKPVYTGCGILYSADMGKCDFTDCCEKCDNTPSGPLVIESDGQHMQQIKSSAFGRAALK